MFLNPSNFVSLQALESFIIWDRSFHLFFKYITMLPIQLLLDDKWCCCMSACYRCCWSLSTGICWWYHEQWKSFEVHYILVPSSAILVHPPRNFLISFPLFFFLFYWFTGHKPAQWEQTQTGDYIPCEGTHLPLPHRLPDPSSHNQRRWGNVSESAVR